VRINNNVAIAGGRVLPNSTIDQAHTVSVWCRTDTTAAGLVFAFSNRDDNRVYIGRDGSTIYLRVANGTNMVSDTITADVWTHLAVSWNGGNAFAYVDGVQTGSATSLSWNTSHNGAGTAIGSYLSDFNLGSADDTYSNFWSGDVADVRIWDRQLAPSEVFAIYTELLQDNPLTLARRAAVPLLNTAAAPAAETVLTAPILMGM
jgi:hypothetical protein